MDQETINQEEWSKQENWSGPRLFSVYFSKKDSRLWVPKQIPKMGWTFNLGHPKGVVCFGIVIIAAILIPITITLLICINCGCN